MGNNSPGSAAPRRSRHPALLLFWPACKAEGRSFVAAQAGRYVDIPVYVFLQDVGIMDWLHAQPGAVPPPHRRQQ